MPAIMVTRVAGERRVVAPGPRSNLFSARLLSFRPNKRRVINVEARHTAKLKAISQARPIIMYSMLSYLFSGFAPCGALALPLWAGEAWLALGAKDIAV